MEVPLIKAASAMKTSEDGVEYIKSVEGFSSYPYYDYGQYTVGYGTRCPGNKYSYYKEHGITDEEAEELLKEHLKYTEDEINKKLIDNYGLELTQNQFDALVSFSFNVGTSWISTNKANTMRNTIANSTDANSIVYAFSLYSNAGGSIMPALATRRLCEANMYLNGVYSTKRDADFCCVYYDTNGGDLTYKIQGFLASVSPSPIKDAVYENHNFIGWYTDLIDGTKTTGLTSELHEQTLFARWNSEDGAAENAIDPIKVIVTEEWVNVRKGPGTNYEKCGKVALGDEVEITHIINRSTLTWGKIEGGWICVDYTTYNEINNENKDAIPEDATEPQETDATENTEQVEEPKILHGVVEVKDSLRIRKGPGTNNATVGYLHNNDTVDIYEVQEVAQTKWGRIGEDKWVSLSYIVLEVEEETEPTEENLNDSVVESIPEATTEVTEETTEATDAPTEESSEPEQTEEITTPEKEEPVIEETTPVEDGSVSDDVNNETSSETETETKEEPEKTPNGNAETEVLNGVVVVNDYLRVRSGPGTTYAAVDRLHDGDEVEIFERQDVYGMIWGRIGEGRWVSMNYISLQEPENATDNSESVTDDEDVSDAFSGVVTANSLRVRCGPGFTYETVGYLDKNTVVKITEQQTVNGTIWGKTNQGWVSMTYIDGSASVKDESESFKTVTANSLKVRKEAGTSSEIVAYLSKGTKVKILEVMDLNGDKWGRMSKGWISLKYTK